MLCGMQMRNPSAFVHPEGEVVSSPASPPPIWPVDTPGGRFYAEFDPDTPLSREGQLVFFAQFLHQGGRWQRFLQNCPLVYSGNRGSKVVNVLGTVFMSVLAGHWRYAHVSAIRGDAINPDLLGMTATVSEDVIRDAMKRMPEAEALQWLSTELRACVAPMLSQPWILDIDATVKPVYGHQQGAEVGYNPQKPGRPSLVYHSYFMANTRLCLGLEVTGGKESAGKHGLPGMWSILDQLPRSHWPAFVRGDCSYGNEGLLGEAERRGLPCLLKLKYSPKVKELVRRMQHCGGRWQDAGQGWETLEARLCLSGWSGERRVVLVREKPAVAPMGARAKRRKDRMSPVLPGAKNWVPSAAPWAGKLVVLVTTLSAKAYPGAALARLYRERADAENVYDELKNQWGWGGFTTKLLGPTRIMGNMVALVYNWWSLYGRMFDGEHHREAITSRPALLGGVARMTRSGGQRTVKVSMQHEKGRELQGLIVEVSKTLQRFGAITEGWSEEQRWGCLLTYIFRRWLGGKWLGTLPAEAGRFLSG